MPASAKNFGQLKASLDSWAREILDDDLKADAINDSITKLWSRVLQANVETFVGGPVNLSIAAGTERMQLASVPDPVAAPVLGFAPSGALAQHTLVGGYTLVTESGSETMLSPTVQQVVPINDVLTVAPPAVVASAIGWNAYIGSSLALLAKQNPVPIPFGQPWQEPNSGNVDAPDGGPVPPTENTTADDIFYIRLLESPLSSGGYKRWESVSLDSSLFQWATRSIATASEYQPLYWDLVNGRQLEYRPKSAMAYVPRYFFIHKPRRIIFDQAPIPFYTFDWEEFIRSYSMAAIRLALSESQEAQAWDQKAQQSLQEIVMTIAQQNWSRNTRVAPFMR